MIPAYSPQARGRSEHSFGTARPAATGVKAGWHRNPGSQPTQFFRQHYIAAFNQKFAVAAIEKGTAFRRTSRSDLDWIFTVQTERVVVKDNTVAIADRNWQLERAGFAVRWRAAR